MNFLVGDPVLYIPKHAYGNDQHPDCEHGVVTSTNEKYVLVLYDGMATPQATDPESLRRLIKELS